MGQIKVSDLVGLATLSNTDYVLITEDLGGSLYDSKKMLISDFRNQIGINGTINYVPKFNGIGYSDSQIFDSGTFVGINTATPSGIELFGVNGRGYFSTTLGVGASGTSSSFLTNFADSTNSDVISFFRNINTGNASTFDLRIGCGTNFAQLLYFSPNLIDTYLQGNFNIRALGKIILGSPIQNSNIDFISGSTTAKLTFDGVTGNIGVNQTLPLAKLHAKGDGSTSATSSLIVENSSSLINFQVKDDGEVSSRLAYWLGYAGINYKILHFNEQGGGVGNLFCGANNGQNAISNFNCGFGNGTLTSLIGGTENVAVGFSTLNSLTNGSYNVCIGRDTGSALITGSSNTFVGYGCGAETGLNNISNSIAIGQFSKIKTNNQLVIGEQSSSSHVSECIIGYGDVQTTGFSGVVNFRSTNVDNGVLDQNNDYLIFYSGGRGTGLGNGSDVIFRTAPPTVTGNTQNPYVELIRLKGAVDQNIEINTNQGALILSRLTAVQITALTGVNGMVVYNTTTNKFQGYEGGLWIDLI